MFLGVCGCLPYTLYRFPLDTDLRNKWIKVVNRQKSETDRTLWQPTDHSVICSAHFMDGQPTDVYPIPTLNLGYNVQQQLGQLPTVRKRRHTDFSHTVVVSRTRTPRSVCRPPSPKPEYDPGVIMMD